MLDRKSVSELINGFDESFEDILIILKAISNNKRLTILLSLLTGEKTFNDLKKETEVKKTALSNHLSKLIKTELILKPDHNKYRLTSDGELFIRVLETTFNRSDIKEKKRTDDLQRKQFSDSFVEYFFG